MSSRSGRASTARETLRILLNGQYESPVGGPVSIRAELDLARAHSVLYTPRHLDAMVEHFARRPAGPPDSPPTNFEVVNETTLHAARRLLAEAGRTRVLALNFASARHPGGGFLKGSQAQEESLARASGLYACLEPFRAMYDANAGFRSCLYTDHLIYSPDVPVFRDDEDALLECPYPLSFVTTPAVNVGALRKNEPHRLREVESVMLGRMAKVLSVAAAHGHDVLVLGAWGCGVFGNDPDRVAGWFHQHLAGEGLFRRAFRKVVFAVLDRTPEGSTLRPFEQHFGRG